MSQAALRVLFVLPGLHRVGRGAEAAFEAVARELARRPDFAVTLAGSGPPRTGEPYRFIQVPVRPRERFEHWPRIPPLRNEYRWEELTFIPPLWRAVRPSDYDVTVTCSYPFVNWALRLRRRHGRPRHVFVTQNGDWPARRANAEYRFFACDGLVCTNPDYYARQQHAWRCALIPNGMDARRFVPGRADRAAFGIPEGVPVVLMVSALIPSKFVSAGVQAVAALPSAHLVVAGDGPARGAVDALAARLLPGRFTRLTTTPERMPALYRCADIFLHLSRDEAFGNVYVEALATGLPVVAHDYPTARWILGDHGRLVDSTVEANVVDALRTTLAAPGPAAPRHAFAAEHYDWPAVAERYAAFLTAVAAVPSASA